MSLTGPIALGYGRPRHGPALPRRGRAGNAPCGAVRGDSRSPADVIVVRPGDTLWDLSLKYKVDLDVLLRANNGTDVIYPNQQLVISRRPAPGSTKNAPWGARGRGDADNDAVSSVAPAWQRGGAGREQAATSAAAPPSVAAVSAGPAPAAPQVSHAVSVGIGLAAVLTTVAAMAFAKEEFNAALLTSAQWSATVQERLRAFARACVQAVASGTGAVAGAASETGRTLARSPPSAPQKEKAPSPPEPAQSIWRCLPWVQARTQEEGRKWAVMMDEREKAAYEAVKSRDEPADRTGGGEGAAAQAHEAGTSPSMAQTPVLANWDPVAFAIPDPIVVTPPPGTAFREKRESAVLTGAAEGAASSVEEGRPDLASAKPQEAQDEPGPSHDSTVVIPESSADRGLRGDEATEANGTRSQGSAPGSLAKAPPAESPRESSNGSTVAVPTASEVERDSRSVTREKVVEPSRAEGRNSAPSAKAPQVLPRAPSPIPRQGSPSISVPLRLPQDDEELQPRAEGHADASTTRAPASAAVAAAEGAPAKSPKPPAPAPAQEPAQGTKEVKEPIRRSATPVDPWGTVVPKKSSGSPVASSASPTAAKESAATHTAPSPADGAAQAPGPAAKDGSSAKAPGDASKPREEAGEVDERSGLTVIMPGDVKNAMTTEDTWYRSLRYLCVPLFVYGDGGKGYFIVDLSMSVEADPDRRLICFEDKRDAESFIEAVQEWEQFKEARKADVVPEHPLQMEELAVRRGCKLLVLHQGEIKGGRGTTEMELVERLQEAYNQRVYGKVMETLKKDA